MAEQPQQPQSKPAAVETDAVDALIEGLDLDHEYQDLYRKGIAGIVQKAAGLDAEKLLKMCLFHEFFRQEPVASFGQHYKIGVDDFTFDIVRLLVAFLVETLVHEFDTRRLSRAVEYYIFGAKTGKNLNSQVFRNLAHPLGQFADRYGIIPLVDHVAEAETK